MLRSIADTEFTFTVSAVDADSEPLQGLIVTLAGSVHHGDPGSIAFIGAASRGGGVDAVRRASPPW